MYSVHDYESIINYARKLEGLTLREKLNGSYNIGGGKGNLGVLVEKEYFGYKPNSRQEADFAEVGIELKVCPLKEIRRVKSSKMLLKKIGRSAKERIIITMIDYIKLAEEDWNKATVRKKLKILLMFYLYDNNVEVDEQVFELVGLWEPTENDMLIIKNDWLLIKEKVKQGLAHEISEGDTMLLGACTKGANSSSVRKQPFSTVTARQRAFSLKRNYVDYIIEEILQSRIGQYSSKRNTLLYKVADIQSLSSHEFTFFQWLEFELNSLRYMSLVEIIMKYKIGRERKAKHYISLVINDIISSMCNRPLKDIAELNKTGIEIKCIVLQPNGIPKEAMSFQQINYCEIVSETWDDSKIRDKFENKKHLWVILQSTRMYKKQSDLGLSEIYFYGAFFWNMPITDLEGHYKVLWEDTIFKIKNNRYDEFMKQHDNPVGHIRPKAKNSIDMAPTPQGSWAKKMSFWLNSKYISKEIKKRMG